MAQALQGASFSGTIRVVLSGPQAEQATISVRDGKAQLLPPGKVTGAAGFEVITSPETWLAIAEGTLAPLDAFTGGRMRVRGDTGLGRRVMTYLAAGAGRTGFC